MQPTIDTADGTDVFSLRRLAIVAAMVASLAAAFVAPSTPAADARADASTAAEATRASNVAAAATAFLDTLPDAQRTSVLFAFTDDAQRVRWSNFPDGAVPRSGLRWGLMNAAQRSALTGLLGAVLSVDGLRMVREQMDADDVLRTSPAGAQPPLPPPDGDRAGPGRPAGGPRPAPGGGAPGMRPPVHFGSDWYYVSFVGTPSATAPWTLQFGGHHLAINATVAGSRITLSPSLTGGEPLKYDRDGNAVYIVGNEVRRATAMLDSLTEPQRRKAVIGARPIDLVLGPGHDGQVLQPEGLSGSEMTDAQRALLLAVVEARLGMLNADSLATAMAVVRDDLERTRFAWWGPTDVVGGAYYRVTGPTVLIEYAPQDADGDATDHAHNIYRDPTNEYGAAWASSK